MTDQLSEKLTETLFNIYLHRLFELGEVTFFAPSIKKEATLGYDGRFVGNKNKWELLLQFKQPEYKENKFFRFSVKAKQLDTLQEAIKLSPGIQDYVYYAAPVFKDISEVNGLQKIAHDECCFLNHYILIKASSLPSDTTYVFFGRADNSKPSHCFCHTPIKPSFKTRRDSNPTKILGSHSLGDDDWIMVCDGVERFKRREIGTQIVPAQADRLERFRGDDSVFSRNADTSRTSLTDLIDAFTQDTSESPLIIRLNSFEQER